MSKEYAEKFKLSELMVVAAAREIKDGELVIVGTGLPILAAALAKRTHAPNSIMAMEHGAFDFTFTRAPRSIVDPDLTLGAAMAGDMFDMLGSVVQGGNADVGFLGAAQIDIYGNINTTVIGDLLKPKVRLPGSGGANDIASSAKRVVIIIRHEKEKFVEKVDYITSPGYLNGPGAREKAGLRGGGPSVVISTMGTFRFDDKTKEMYLDTYHPGITIEQVRQNTGFHLKVSPSVRETEPPTVQQINILREVDREGLFL
ncbi:MAG: CoA-transferase [Methanobacteriota archaeon]